MKVSERKSKPLCLICGERPAVSKGLCQRCYVFMRQRPDIETVEQGRIIWQEKKKERESRPTCAVCKTRVVTKQDPNSPAVKKAAPQKTCGAAFCIVMGKNQRSRSSSFSRVCQKFCTSSSSSRASNSLVSLV